MFNHKIESLSPRDAIVLQHEAESLSDLLRVAIEEMGARTMEIKALVCFMQSLRSSGKISFTPRQWDYLMYYTVLQCFHDGILVADSIEDWLSQPSTAANAWDYFSALLTSARLEPEVVRIEDVKRPGETLNGGDAWEYTATCKHCKNVVYV